MTLRDEYGVFRCTECGSLGTIVQLGACCSVAMMQGMPVQFALFEGRAAAAAQKHGVNNGTAVPNPLRS